MGPRAFAHGDHTGLACLFRYALCFNGAAGFRPRRPLRLCLARQIGSQCFNGAAGFRPRRLDGHDVSVNRREWLQWGRGLSPTETKLG